MHKRVPGQSCCSPTSVTGWRVCPNTSTGLGFLKINTFKPDIVQQIASSVSNLLRRSCRYGMLRLARHVWELLGYVSTRAVRDDPRLPAAENKSGEECAREIAELATKNASEAAHVAEEDRETR